MSLDNLKCLTDLHPEKYFPKKFCYHICPCGDRDKNYLLDHITGIKWFECKWESRNDPVSLYGDKHDWENTCFSQSVILTVTTKRRFYNPAF